MLKYEFSIRTKDGQKIESIVIAGKDSEDAARKLRQMYRHCEVIHCGIKGNTRPVEVNSVEEILTLISK